MGTQIGTLLASAASGTKFDLRSKSDQITEVRRDSLFFLCLILSLLMSTSHKLLGVFGGKRPSA